MIDTDKYTGHTEGPWTLSEEYAYELFVYAGDVRLAKMDYSSRSLNPYQLTEDVNAQLIADAPLLLEEVKRLCEYYTTTLERVKTEKNLKLWEKAEAKRLREAIADIANNMEAADDSYMSGFIEDLRKVIE